MVERQNEIFVQCIFSDADVEHIEKVLFPSLLLATRSKIHFVGKNFEGKVLPVNRTQQKRLSVSYLKTDNKRPSGFAENHNDLFREFSKNSPFFILINPDCIAGEASIDYLIQTYEAHAGRAGIVEGRQWPFEHPKEFNSSTKETPWASGAFALIDSRFYNAVGGMDENYFLYTEDVDLSWRAWLAGYKVLYEREAVVMHFTGGPFSLPEQFDAEKYYSLRNYILISRKYFGERGEKIAIRQLKLVLEKQHFDWIIRGYNIAKTGLDLEKYRGSKHRMVKITGVNLYHEVQR